MGKARHARRWRTTVRRHPWRSAAAAAVTVVLVATTTSYVQRLRQPGNESVSEKSVEWVRDHHGGAVVDLVENQWYTHHAPRVGGSPRAIATPSVAGRRAPVPSTTPSTTAPAPPAATSTSTTTTAVPTHRPPPADVVGPATPAVAGEGHWVPVGPPLDGASGLYVTQLRPDAVHTSFLDLAAWMDPSVVRMQLHPGLEVPGGRWSTPSYVPDPLSTKLVAAFNSGFRMADSQGGYYAEGRSAVPLQDGKATLVIDRDGVIDVVDWGRDRSMGPDVVAARQNLSLIVDHGALVPGLDENAGNRWGKTVGNKVFVWRSGLGVTADGALVYVGGPSFSARTLAETLRRVGAVRAMELDINWSWVSFNTYRPSGTTEVGTAMLPEMKKPGSRYLSPDSRDFVAVERRDVPLPAPGR